MRHTWNDFVRNINNRNLAAVKELKKINIKPKHKYFNFDKWIIDVPIKEFPYKLANGRYNGSGSFYGINGEIFYATKNIEIRTDFVLPWHEHNHLLLDCPSKIRKSIASFIELFYQKNVLNDLKGKREAILKNLLLQITNKIKSILRKKELEEGDKRDFKKLIKAWEDLTLIDNILCDKQ